MSTPRRRLVRPAVVAASPEPRDQRRIQKLRTQLDHERTALVRWQTRFRRAFNSVQKIQQRISRIERQITRLEDL